MEKLRHFELGDRGLGGTFLHALKGRPQPQMADEARIPFREGVCMQRKALPHSPLVSMAPGDWAGIRLWISSRFLGAPALSLRPVVSRSLFPYETPAVPSVYPIMFAELPQSSLLHINTSVPQVPSWDPSPDFPEESSVAST